MILIFLTYTFCYLNATRLKTNKFLVVEKKEVLFSFLPFRLPTHFPVLSKCMNETRTVQKKLSFIKLDHYNTE